jgi:acetyl esterase/lipase
MKPNRNSVRGVVFAFAMALVAAACGGSESAADPPTTVSTVAGTGAATTTEAPTTTEAAGSFTETSDVIFRTIDGVDLLMDIYTPEGEGPWPVVVAFHGLDSRLKDSVDSVAIGEAAAGAGMMVFAASWIVFGPDLFPLTVDVFQQWKQTANCAVAFAQQTANDLGGDPANTALYGFSAGIGPSVFASLEPTEEPIAGCATDASATPPVGVVLGDGEYFLHTENFDPPFQEDLEAMRTEVALMTDAGNWPADLDAKFYLWVAECGTNGRPIGDPTDETGWLWQRDRDGSIYADLDRLDQIEDGVFSYIDSGEVMALRLSAAGIDVTLDEYPGCHETLDKIPALLGYLKDAVGAP